MCGFLALPFEPTCLLQPFTEGESAIHSRTFYVPDTAPGAGDSETKRESPHLPGTHSLVGRDRQLLVITTWKPEQRFREAVLGT